MRLDRDSAGGATTQHDISGTSRVAGDEQERPRLVHRPGEAAADRPADLEHVAGRQLAGEGRAFAVLALDANPDEAPPAQSAIEYVR